MKYNPKERCFESAAGDKYFFAYWWEKCSVQLHLASYDHHYSPFPFEAPISVKKGNKIMEFDFLATKPYVCIYSGLVVHLTDGRMALIIGDPENYDYPGIKATILDDNFNKKEKAYIQPSDIVWYLNDGDSMRNSDGELTSIHLFFIPDDCFLAQGYQAPLDRKLTKGILRLAAALAVYLILGWLLPPKEMYAATAAISISIIVWGAILVARNINRIWNPVAPAKDYTSDAWEAYLRRRTRLRK